MRSHSLLSRTACSDMHSAEHRCSGGVIPQAAGKMLALLLLVLSCSVQPLQAADILEHEATRHGTAIKNAFRELVARVPHYVLKVQVNEAGTAPGTLVDARRGWAVAKASELGEVLTAKDAFRCQLHSGGWVPAKFVSLQREHDLVFLQLELPAGTGLPAVKQSTTLQPGQWVITPGFQQEVPIAVGVLGALPREIEATVGSVGMNVEESDQGLIVTRVLANSSASKAGVKKGDLILKEDLLPAKRRDWLTKHLNSFDPGDWTELSVSRDGKPLRLDLRLGINWDNLVDRQAMMNRFGSDVSQRKSGFKSVLQHDGLMHPRECGGPLVNLKGELLGVNIARAGRTDTYAVPLEVILEVFAQQR